MKIQELLQSQSESQKLDEILPALGMLGGAALRAAAPALARAAGSTLSKAAGGVANTLGRATAGATNATRALKTANSLNNIVGKDPEQTAQDNKLKSTLSKLKDTLGMAGGPPIDVNKTSQTLTAPVDPSKPDPAASKNLQALIPGLSQALQHPQSAELISQAIQTGVRADIKQQAKAQQDQAQQAMKSVKA